MKLYVIANNYVYSKCPDCKLISSIPIFVVLFQRFAEISFELAVKMQTSLNF